MEVSDHLHTPAALPQGKSHRCPFDGGGGWVDPRAGLDALAKGKCSSPCRKSNPGRPAVSSVTILIKIPRYANYKILSHILRKLFKYRPIAYAKVNVKKYPN